MFVLLKKKNSYTLSWALVCIKDLLLGILQLFNQVTEKTIPCLLQSEPTGRLGEGDISEPLTLKASNFTPALK